MHKALVTGGAGFLGSHLVERLLLEGIRVVSYDNYFRGNIVNLDAIKNNRRLSIMDGDILDPYALEKAAAGCDIIFHLAAINGTKYFYEIPQEIIEVNIKGTENVLKAAQKQGVSRVVFTSSSEIYGHPETIPTPESSPAIFRPPTGVRWCYAIGKLLDEHMCLAFAREGLFDTVILRIFNAYGPRLVGSDYGQVIAMFVNRLLDGYPPIIHGDGEQTRSFSYVSDIVEGIVKAAITDAASNEIFNLGSQHESTINELVQNMIEVSGVSKIEPIHIEPMPDEPRRRCPSIEKARKLIGYEPEVDLTSGLEKTIVWAKSQRRYS